MLPTAPEKIREIPIITALCTLRFILPTNQKIIAETATILNKVKKSFPVLPPNSKPIAIPLFSTK